MTILCKNTWPQVYNECKEYEEKKSQVQNSEGHETYV